MPLVIRNNRLICIYTCCALMSCTFKTFPQWIVHQYDPDFASRQLSAQGYTLLLARHIAFSSVVLFSLLQHQGLAWWPWPYTTWSPKLFICLLRAGQHYSLCSMPAAQRGAGAITLLRRYRELWQRCSRWSLPKSTGSWLVENWQRGEMGGDAGSQWCLAPYKKVAL